VCSLIFGASQQNTAGSAAELSNYLDMADHLLTEPLVIEGGRMRVPAGPGLGVTLDYDKVEHFRC
jgi:L-alanine-DL-glutamate epimerase-like enolase superfamily enzyme